MLTSGRHVQSTVAIIRRADFEGDPVLLMQQHNEDNTQAHPEPEYLYAMSMGIVETFKLNPRGLRKYLESIQGIKDAYDGSTLNKLAKVVNEDLGLSGS